MQTWIVTADDQATRLDQYLQRLNPDMTRSHVQKLIRDGHVTVNQIKAKTGLKIKTGDQVALDLPEPEPSTALSEAIPLDVVYEDEDIIVVNKPRGMVVHPAAGHASGTLVNALLFHCRDLQAINHTLRPGIVHRLDKDTTGLLVVAKNEQAQQSLVKQMKARQIHRHYIALVHGTIQEENGKVDAPVGRHHTQRKKMAVVQNGRPAVSRFHVLDRFSGYTLVEVRLETGRTHQIRVHMAFIGHPVAGDPLYGPAKSKIDLGGQALHAGYLAFFHPRDGHSLAFQVPLPSDMQSLVEALGGEIPH
jgi:23S rRNA pseudouridine1911/1915/1917 synthase